MRQVPIFRKLIQHGGAVRFAWRFGLGAMALHPPSSALAQRQVLRGHVPAATAALRPTGKPDGGKPMEVLIGLPLRNRETLANLLQNLYDPASPSFHQYLTPASSRSNSARRRRIMGRSSPLPSQRFDRAGYYSGTARCWVSGDGRADIERVFHVTIAALSTSGGSARFLRAGEGAVGGSGGAGVGDHGPGQFCNSASAELHAASGWLARWRRTGSAPDGLYWGNDFRAAYVPGTTLTGAGQTVGLFELDDYYTSDITTYESDAGLSNVPVSRMLVDGATSGNPERRDVGSARWTLRWRLRWRLDCRV